MLRAVFLTAVTTLVQLIFQFMARALQSPRIGLLYFAPVFRRDAREARMESDPVRMTVQWRVPAGEAQSITAALQALMLQTRAAPGCVACSLSTQMGAVVVIEYIEKWNSETDLRRQVRSHRFSALAELIERATETPMVEFTLPGGSRGIEYAEEVRQF